MLSSLNISEKVRDNMRETESLILVPPVLLAPEVLNSLTEKPLANYFLGSAADTCTVLSYYIDLQMH